MTDPADRDLERALTSVLACAFIGAAAAVGEIIVLTVRHLVSPSGWLVPIAAGLAGPAVGVVVGVLSLAAGGRRR